MQFFEKIKNNPTYVKLLQVRDKALKRMLTALLTFFDLIAPVLTFLCIKKPDTQNGTNTGIMLGDKVKDAF